MNNEATTVRKASPAPAISLVVPRALVKTIKSTLERNGQLSKNQKISSANPRTPDRNDETFVVPTNCLSGGLWISDGEALDEAAESRYLESLGLTEYSANIRVISSVAKSNSGDEAHALSKETNAKSLLSRVVDEWVSSLPEDIAKLLCIHNQEPFSHYTISPGNLTYMVYPPLLLLPPTFFSTWPPVFSYSVFPSNIQTLHISLCAAFHVTHIALNGAIPPNLTRQEHTLTSPEQAITNPNIRRSPTNLAPLHGDFGPLLPLSHSPNPSDFDEAFWCTVRQNNIFQAWAPRYTMFSRGNINEKARILQFDTLRPQRLGCLPEETSAVDLYAGIGYFAFSYAKAGVGKVICWEINPWSIEGLRRGAKGNKWGVCKVVQGRDHELGDMAQSKFLVFEESNEHAAKALETIWDSVPPVRHVNCGFLPTSRDSWRIAVEALDAVKGGWIHAHENIAKKDIENRKEEIVQIFEELAIAVYGPAREAKREVECEYLERVKSYAPGVMHCVLDIAIRPVRPSP